MKFTIESVQLGSSLRTYLGTGHADLNDWENFSTGCLYKSLHEHVYVKYPHLLRYIGSGRQVAVTWGCQEEDKTGPERQIKTLLKGGEGFKGETQLVKEFWN